MLNTSKLVCGFAVLLLTVSLAAGVVAVRAAAIGDTAALEKMEPELRTEMAKAMRDSPSMKIRSVFFVGLGSSLDALRSSMEKNGATVVAEYPALGGIAAEVPAKKVAEVASLPDVEKVLLDGKKYAIPAPNGDWAGDYSKIFNPTTGLWYSSTPYTMGVDKVWEKGVTGAGVRVAVLDTGADLAQNDIASAIYDFRSFTSEDFHDVDGHGTSTASLVASRAVNTYYGFIKMQGMAPGAMVMAGKVLGDDGYGWDSWIIGGIEWAVAGSDGDPATDDGAQIISMSLGGLEVPNDGDDPTALALDRAAAEGVASFVAAGNEGMGRGTIGSPGVSKSTITVGASTNNAEAFYLLGYWPFTTTNGKYLASDYENNHMIWWSSRGPTADGRIDPDVAAVGAWGPAATPGNTVDLQFGGTSMATPVAAGIGALVWQAFTEANGRAPLPAELKAILMGTAIDMGYGPAEQGAGRIDAYGAYQAAIGERQIGGLNSLALTLPQGATRSVYLGGTVSSKTFERMQGSGLSFNGEAQRNKDVFFSFTVPDGASYLHADLAFDPVYTFGADVHEFDGTTWTDDHLNLVLYKIENNGRTMVNYAYAHTNSQELNAKVAPGNYQLRVWGAQYVNVKIPFSVGLEFYKTVKWSWANTNGPKATIKVPTDAEAGTHVAYLLVTRGGYTSMLPVAVTVPMKVGVPVKGEIDVNHETYSTTEGDWVYYAIGVPSGAQSLTAVLTWGDWNTCIDLYLIDPSRTVVDASLTPYLGGGLYGPWTTSSGTTAQVVSVQTPTPGKWMIALHDTYLGKVYTAPYMLTASIDSPMVFSANSVTVSPTATVTLSNKLDVPLRVSLLPTKDEIDSMVDTFKGTLTSQNIGGQGYDELLFDVAPGTAAIQLKIEWSTAAADIDVVVYATDGSDRGVLYMSGDTLTVRDPIPGTWEAAVALKNTGQTTPYTLTLTSWAYPAWDDLKLSSYEVSLAPMGSADVTLSIADAMPGDYAGIVFAYDAVTGCTYDQIAVAAVSN